MERYVLRYPWEFRESARGRGTRSVQTTDKAPSKFNQLPDQLPAAVVYAALAVVLSIAVAVAFAGVVVAALVVGLVIVITVAVPVVSQRIKREEDVGRRPSRKRNMTHQPIEPE